MAELRQGHALDKCPACGSTTRSEGKGRVFCRECRATVSLKTPRRWHKWTEQEQDIVRRGFDGTKETSCRLAGTIGVTPSQIHYKAQYMGLLTASDYGKRPWTQAEDAQLEKWIGRLSAARIGVRLNRSLNAVTVRARRLGLSRRYRDGWYTKREVCEILGKEHKWVQQRIDSGDLKASWHNGHKPQQKGMAMWHITEAALKRFICEHAYELTGRNVDLLAIVDILVGQVGASMSGDA